jgi:hypothetical protein
LNDNKISSSNAITETSPVGSNHIGVKAAILTSTSNTSIANKPGTAKAAAIPAAPQPIEAFGPYSLYFLGIIRTKSGPVITIGLSKPAEPPKPTVNELVTIWAYICFF